MVGGGVTFREGSTLIQREVSSAASAANCLAIATPENRIGAYRTCTLSRDAVEERRPAGQSVGS